MAGPVRLAHKARRNGNLVERRCETAHDVCLEQRRVHDIRADSSDQVRGTPDPTCSPSGPCQAGDLSAGRFDLGLEPESIVEYGDVENHATSDQMGRKRSQRSLGTTSRQAVYEIENSQEVPPLPPLISASEERSGCSRTTIGENNLLTRVPVPSDSPDHRTERAIREATRDTVLFVTHVGHFGGSAASLRTLLRHLGRNVRRVLVAPAQGPLGAEIAAEGLVDELVAVPGVESGQLDARSAARFTVAVVRTVLRHRGRLGAVHSNGLADLVLAAPVLTTRRLPVVTWAHEDDASARRSRRLAGGIARLARVRLVTVSSSAADSLAQATRVPRGRIVVVPNPIEDTAVAESRVVAPGIVRIGFLGTDTWRKGFDLLPTVIHSLDRPSARFLVFARHHDGLAPEFEHAWRKLEHDPRVELRGRQDDVRRAYAECDVVFCPSRSESFCRVAAEAMMNGIPVVASDLPPLRELLGDDEAGCLFTTGDTLEAGAVLGVLVDDEKLRASLGRAGRLRAARFDADHVAECFAALYELSGSGAEVRERS
jgi:glycosyltransferase involved in cell wall biosynthesis